MALLFFLFVSMINPRAHELEKMSEEEEEQGNKTSQGKKTKKTQNNP
jgi:hypothetical protein